MSDEQTVFSDISFDDLLKLWWENWRLIPADPREIDFIYYHTKLAATEEIQIGMAMGL